MRICGRQFVLFTLTSIGLAACGGETSTGGASGNLPPIIEGTPPTTLTAGSTYSFTPSAADPDGDSLTFSVANAPDWTSFDSATGRLTGTPTSADVGMSDPITIEVSDRRSVTQLPSFRIQVTSTGTAPGEVNTPPTIAGNPATTANVGQLYVFTPIGDDVDDDNLTFTIENAPSWATFTAATGVLRGTPGSSNVGTTSNIVIRVSDGEAGAALPAFNLQVVGTAPPANRPPTISGTPSTSVTAGSAYSFRPVASDPDGNPLTFSIQNQPSWATFSTSTGRLAGTPTTANVGTSARITITVSDSTASVSLPSFTIQVNTPANRAPTISGNPSTGVIVGTAYSFQPSASDPDGNTLSFSISNRPAWATFSTSNGRLSGTPAAGDVASYAGIVISVSDGTAITSLPAFTLAVMQTASGTAQVSWTPPTTNTDGSALTDLAGYRIAYGRSSSALDQSASVTNVGVTNYTVNNLTSGEWFFGVFAVNAQGIESGISNLASKTIP